MFLAKCICDRKSLNGDKEIKNAKILALKIPKTLR